MVRDKETNNLNLRLRATTSIFKDVAIIVAGSLLGLILLSDFVHAAVTINTGFDQVIPMVRHVHKPEDTNKTIGSGSPAVPNPNFFIDNKNITPGDDLKFKYCDYGNGVYGAGLIGWVSTEKKPSEELPSIPYTPDGDTQDLQVNFMGTQCLSNMAQDSNSNGTYDAGETPVTLNRNFNDYGNVNLISKNINNTWAFIEPGSNVKAYPVSDFTSDGSEAYQLVLGAPPEDLGLTLGDQTESDRLKVEWSVANTFNRFYALSGQTNYPECSNTSGVEVPSCRPLTLRNLHSLTQEGSYLIQIEVKVAVVNEFASDPDPTSDGVDSGWGYYCTHNDGTENYFLGNNPTPPNNSNGRANVIANCRTDTITLNTFYRNIETSALRIQGQKVIGEGSSMSVPGASVSPGNAELEMVQGTTDTTGVINDQPFSFEGLSYADNRIIEVEEPPGYKLIGYTWCEKPGGSLLFLAGGGSGPLSEPEEPCDHTHTVTAMPDGRVTIPEQTPPGNDANYYIDIWFHYEEIEDKPEIVFRKVLNDGSCTLLNAGDSAANDKVEFYDTSSAFLSQTEDDSSNARTGRFTFAESTDYLRIFPDDPTEWNYVGFSRDVCTSGPTNNTGLSIVPLSGQDERNVYFYYEEVEIEEGYPEKKIYGSVDADITPDAVRDNRRLDISVSSYLWPDATHRFSVANFSSGFNSKLDDYLWTAGAYGERVSDTFASQSGSSSNNLNTTQQFNTDAEYGCPENCNHRVPLAYVSAPDTGPFPNTHPDGSDGKTTPNGNQWLRIRQEQYGSSHVDNDITSCGTYTDSYHAHCGGRASNKTNNIGGAVGNHLRTVEISNIRVESDDLALSLEDGSLQGYVGNNVLQVSDISTRNLSAPGYLPGASQGPTGTTQKWDNIRNPISPNNPLQVTGTDGSHTYQNTQTGGSTSYGKLLIPADNMTSTYLSRDTQVATVQTTSLLQDGNGTYDEGSEPLSYTAALDSADDVKLVWDEYVDWTQVDDKGHWYTTNETRPTGMATGPADTDQYTLQRITSSTRGTPEYLYTDHSGQENYPCDSDDDGEEDETCQRHNHSLDVDVYTTCSVNHTYNSGIAYRYNDTAYYVGSSQSRFGWTNTASATTGILNDTSFNSKFAPNPANNPSWSNTGSTSYWQDNSKTPMSTSGTSLAPSHTNRWIYDTSDRAYTNRTIFANTTTPNFKTDWYYTTSSGCTYPNGYVENYFTGTTDNHYHTPFFLYETSTVATGIVFGRYNFADDGDKDGRVDTNWHWKSNLQRVRYEHTWTGHTRELGDRYSWRKGGRPGYTVGTNTQRQLLYGLQPALTNTTDPRNGDNYSASILSSRGTALIFNPRTYAANADVFAAGGLDSYFRGDSTSPGNSFVSSAFVFTQNGPVTNVDNQRTFNNYFINPDHDVGARLEENNLAGLFTNLSQLKSGAQNIAPSTLNGAFPLNGRTYIKSGNLTLNGTRFRNGAGTIIVEGNLIISNTTSYHDTGIGDRTDLPSVGFIVEGDVIVNSNVTGAVGAFAVNKCFIIDSALADANSNCTSYTRQENTTFDGDPGFTLHGLVVADRFALLRQPSGTTLQASPYAEAFRYDGRVVVNNPPGFSRIFTEPQDWIEVTPRN